MLYPESNECRMLTSLDGFWNFKVEEQPIDPAQPLANSITMAVPASFNDQVIDQQIRNHDGYFWYQTTFNVSKMQLAQRNVLRFGSVTHEATVYVNGKQVGHHQGGFTPFEIELDGQIHPGENDLKVRVSNLLSNKTIPVGKLTEENGNYHVDPNFDFFNYAGIHRPVKLYTTSRMAHIDEIVVKYDTDLKQTTVNPEVRVTGDFDQVVAEILDEDGNRIERVQGNSLNEIQKMVISDTHLWQPMNAYLYRLKISLLAESELIDTYTQEFGVRKVEVKDAGVYINDQPIYLKGFGRHEDFPIIGKGMNRAVINHDHQTMKWMHANAFRTSHYPYSEEEMRLADRDGFLVIDEVPAVGLYAGFSVSMMGQKAANTWKTMQTMDAHKQVIQETITRDQNHPSVIMWSVANEPASQQEGAHEYFKEITDYTRQLDWQHLPLVAPKIASATVDVDLTGDLFDVIALNRYYGWYIDFNDLAQAKSDLMTELQKWHRKFPDKPILFTEFGADTLSGMHSINREPYSEEYQHDYYQMNFDVFDQCDFVCGELLWNFADFATPAGLIRVDGNKKGIFTRDRQPKQIVYDLKKRWENK